MNEGTDEIQKPKTSRKRRVGLLVLIAAVAGLLWFTMVSRGPSYHGKSLSFWLANATANSVVLYDQKDPKAAECRAAIRTIGTNAIPPLLRMRIAERAFLLDPGYFRAYAAIQLWSLNYIGAAGSRVCC
jgi:hypothetical protein